MDQWIGSPPDQATDPGPPDLCETIILESGRAGRASMVGHAMFAKPRIAARIVRTSGQHARRREHLLFLLLGQIAEEARAGSDLLRPVWVHEAACRAANLSRLVHLMRPPAMMRHAGPMIHRIEYALAADLASLCRLTAARPDRDMVPCSTVLRDVISNLVALFEGTAGVQLRTDIERISLPAYKRRALVLAAAELVALALLRGCEGRTGGRLIVSIGMVNDRNARLIVADDVAGARSSRVTERQGAAAGLSELLEGNLLYPEYGWAETVAEIAFPVRP